MIDRERRQAWRVAAFFFGFALVGFALQERFPTLVGVVMGGAIVGAVLAEGRGIALVGWIAFWWARASRAVARAWREGSERGKR